MRKSGKKLSLHLETLRSLEPSRVAGGTLPSIGCSLACATAAGCTWGTLEMNCTQSQAEMN